MGSPPTKVTHQRSCLSHQLVLPQYLSRAQPLRESMFMEPGEQWLGLSALGFPKHKSDQCT